MRHGCLFTCVLTLLLAGASRAEPILVDSATFELVYEVNDDALPLDLVTLWHSRDGGATWTRFGVDDDRQSPMSIRAPGEGLHGFHLVLQNPAGSSHADPGPGIAPQLSVLVDFRPPTAQLHPPRLVPTPAGRVVQIRWTADDANLTDRPVQLHFRRLPDRPWQPVIAEPLADLGRFDWRIPGDLHGPVAVRLTVEDRAGRRTVPEAQAIEIMPIAARPPAEASTGTSPPGDRNVESQALIASLQDRSQQLLAQALVLRDQGAYPEAVSRLREVVRLDPLRADAFVEMGELLYHMGDLDRALNAYELALRRDPLSRRALRGAAIAHRRRNDHEAAARLLRAILQANPNDAEVWINLGDISVFQGDEVMARECYTRASLVDPSATQVVEDARRRLELMSTVSRTYVTDHR